MVFHALRPHRNTPAAQTTQGNAQNDSSDTHHNASAETVNAIKAVSKPKKALKPTLSHFQPVLNPMVFVLGATALFQLYQGKSQDALIIALVLVVYAFIQAMVQWRCEAEKSKTADVSHFHYRVYRNSQEYHLQSKDLQVNDRIMVKAGQPVPADCCLISSTDLQVDESILTGESRLVFKHVNPAQTNTGTEALLYAGTQVRTGSGEAIITAINDQVAIQQIGQLAHNKAQGQTSFAQTIHQFFRQVWGVTALMLMLMVGLSLYQGASALTITELVLMTLLAVMPGLLPTLANVLVVSATERLKRDNIQIISPRALEFLNRVTTLCCDKTGTLTENNLTVAQLYLPEIGAVPYHQGLQQEDQIPYPAITRLFTLARLNNTVTASSGIRGHIMGDPTDVALYQATPAGLERNHRKLTEVPFDPVQMLSAALYDTDEGYQLSCIKGAPEMILKRCRYYMRPDGTVMPMTLSPEYITQMFNNDIAFEKDYRIIGFAEKRFKPGQPVDDLFDGATFIGWVCLVDAQRDGAASSMATLKANGIQVVMITGDQHGTAAATAKKLGILGPDDTVWQRDRLVQENYNLDAKAKVFVRTQPEDKLRIVQALQNRGEIVAMVGDGVNDTPALKQSNVAIAMGRSTDGALNNADMVLLDDRFEGLMNAVHQSHLLHKKLQTCSLYLLSNCLGLATVLMVYFGFFQHTPFSMLQVLWLSLVIMTLPMAILALEPVLGMPRQSTHHRQGLLQSTQWFFVAYWGACIVMSATATYSIFSYLLPQPSPAVNTLLFATVGFSQVMTLFSVQFYRAKGSFHQFISELMTTPTTWLAIGVTSWLQWWAIYTPAMNKIFQTIPVDSGYLLMAMGISVVITTLSNSVLDLSRD